MGLNKEEDNCCHNWQIVERICAEIYKFRCKWCGKEKEDRL